MLSCTCRKKSRKQSSHTTRLLSRRKSILLGSNFQASFASLVASLLPPGVVLVGIPTPFGPWAGYTLNPNTSNNPEPTFLPTFSGLIYKTPKCIWGAKARLFVKDHQEKLATHFSDVNQGNLGDCWVMSALSALAAYGNVSGGRTLIQDAFASVDPAGAVNPNKVTVTLYRPDYDNHFGHSADPFPQTVDTKIPVDRADPTQPVFAMSDSPGEYWPCMMEKALAASLTSTDDDGNTVIGYPALIGGWVTVGMSFFTPGLPLWFQYPEGFEVTGDQLYAAWNELMATGITVGISWISNPDGGVASGGEAYGYYGLVSQHTYTVYSIINAGGYKLALIRNPWGTGSCEYNQQSNDGEWTGPWSDCSPQWDANPIVKAACGFTGPRSDGLFWISFDDIAKFMLDYEIFIPDRADMRAKDLRPSPFNACRPLEGYLPLADVKHTGNDIAKVHSSSLASIAKACNKDSDCLGFNQDGWLENAQPSLTSAKGNCYYVKTR